MKRVRWFRAFGLAAITLMLSVTLGAQGDPKDLPLKKLQDIKSQSLARSAHPEVTVTVAPPVFYSVALPASGAIFSADTSTTKGDHTRVEKDVTNKTNGLTFRDEDTANRVAKAMIHAMELCVGVTKKNSSNASVTP